MRAGTSILLALCLCLGLAAADDHMCGPSGMAGGWSPIEGDVDKTLLDTIGDAFDMRFGANLTELLNGMEVCPPEDVTMSAFGCQQVVAGTNYKLWVNMSCNAADGNYTVGLSVEAFKPLPTNADAALQIYDLDVEFIAVDGSIVKADFDDDDILDDAGWIEGFGSHDMDDHIHDMDDHMHDHDLDDLHDDDDDDNDDGPLDDDFLTDRTDNDDGDD